MKMKRILALILSILVIFSAAVPAAASEGTEITVLFTHDLHSHFLPTLDENGNSYGGYARLQTAINEQKAIDPNALLVDAGDFSMGSLFQTVFATHASELRIMGHMGYDVTIFGNHEFDYRPTGLSNMLNAAVDSGDPLPQIVDANYLPPLEGEEGYTSDSKLMWDALNRYGVKDYTVVNKNGINFAIFGIMGVDSDECAPLSGMVYENHIEKSAEVVEAIKKEVPEPRVIVCLSHGGTNEDESKSEDYQLAKNVDGIDIIISGHTHTTLEKPIEVNGTFIVSADEYCKNLGVLKLNYSDGGRLTLSDYKLIPINDTLEDDPFIAGKVEEYKHMVEDGFLSNYGIESFDQVIVKNPYKFDNVEQMNEHKESPLGNIIADAYRWIVEQTEGDGGDRVDFVMTANGVVRDTLLPGDVTMSNVYNISSLGVGPDGIAGYPLVSVYITGTDLKNALEVDASVTAIMPAAQLYFTGVTSTFNPYRMLFNKVTDCGLILDNGEIEPIENDRLYRVVTGLYCGQMLGTVNDKSFGILSITPRDKDGNEITDIEQYIVRDKDGNEIKEWYALTAYLQHLGTVPEEYSKPQGYKNVEPSLNPIKLVKNANWVTLAVIAVALLLVTGIVFLVRAVIRRRRRKAAKTA